MLRNVSAPENARKPNRGQSWQSGRKSRHEIHEPSSHVVQRGASSAPGSGGGVSLNDSAMIGDCGPSRGIVGGPWSELASETGCPCDPGFPGVEGACAQVAFVASIAIKACIK